MNEQKCDTLPLTNDGRYMWVWELFSPKNSANARRAEKERKSLEAKLKERK